MHGNISYLVLIFLTSCCVQVYWAAVVSNEHEEVFSAELHVRGYETITLQLSASSLHELLETVKNQVLQSETVLQKVKPHNDGLLTNIRSFNDKAVAAHNMHKGVTQLNNADVNTALAIPSHIVNLTITLTLDTGKADRFMDPHIFPRLASGRVISIGYRGEFPCGDDLHKTNIEGASYSANDLPTPSSEAFLREDAYFEVNQDREESGFPKVGPRQTVIVHSVQPNLVYIQIGTDTRNLVKVKPEMLCRKIFMQRNCQAMTTPLELEGVTEVFVCLAAYSFKRGDGLQERIARLPDSTVGIAVTIKGDDTINGGVFSTTGVLRYPSMFDVSTPDNSYWHLSTLFVKQTVSGTLVSVKPPTGGFAKEALPKQLAPYCPGMALQNSQWVQSDLAPFESSACFVREICSDIVATTPAVRVVQDVQHESVDYDIDVLRRIVGSEDPRAMTDFLTIKYTELSSMSTQDLCVELHKITGNSSMSVQILRQKLSKDEQRNAIIQKILLVAPYEHPPVQPAVAPSSSTAPSWCLGHAAFFTAGPFHVAIMSKATIPAIRVGPGDVLNGTLGASVFAGTIKEKCIDHGIPSYHGDPTSAFLMVLGRIASDKEYATFCSVTDYNIDLQSHFRGCNAKRLEPMPPSIEGTPEAGLRFSTAAGAKKRLADSILNTGLACLMDFVPATVAAPVPGQTPLQTPAQTPAQASSSQGSSKPLVEFTKIYLSFADLNNPVFDDIKTTKGNPLPLLPRKQEHIVWFDDKQLPLFEGPSPNFQALSIAWADFSQVLQPLSRIEIVTFIYKLVTFFPGLGRLFASRVVYALFPSVDISSPMKIHQLFGTSVFEAYFILKSCDSLESARSSFYDAFCDELSRLDETLTAHVATHDAAKLKLRDLEKARDDKKEASNEIKMLACRACAVGCPNKSHCGTFCRYKDCKTMSFASVGAAVATIGVTSCATSTKTWSDGKPKREDMRVFLPCSNEACVNHTCTSFRDAHNRCFMCFDTLLPLSPWDIATSLLTEVHAPELKIVGRHANKRLGIDPPPKIKPRDDIIATIRANPKTQLKAPLFIGFTRLHPQYMRRVASAKGFMLEAKDDGSEPRDVRHVLVSLGLTVRIPASNGVAIVPLCQFLRSPLADLDAIASADASLRIIDAKAIFLQDGPSIYCDTESRFQLVRPYTKASGKMLVDHMATSMIRLSNGELTAKTAAVALTRAVLGFELLGEGWRTGLTVAQPKSTNQQRFETLHLTGADPEEEIKQAKARVKAAALVRFFVSFPS